MKTYMYQGKLMNIGDDHDWGIMPLDPSNEDPNQQHALTCDIIGPRKPIYVPFQNAVDVNAAYDMLIRQFASKDIPFIEIPDRAERKALILDDEESLGQILQIKTEELKATNPKSKKTYKHPKQVMEMIDPENASNKKHIMTVFGKSFVDLDHPYINDYPEYFVPVNVIYAGRNCIGYIPLEHQ